MEGWKVSKGLKGVKAVMLVIFTCGLFLLKLSFRRFAGQQVVHLALGLGPISPTRNPLQLTELPRPPLVNGLAHKKPFLAAFSPPAMRHISGQQRSYDFPKDTRYLGRKIVRGFARIARDCVPG